MISAEDNLQSSIVANILEGSEKTFDTWLVYLRNAGFD
jgi:hypothetical protein